MKVLLEQVLLAHYYSKRNIDKFNESTSSTNLILIIVISAHIKNFISFQNTVWPSSFGKEMKSAEMEEAAILKQYLEIRQYLR